MARSIGQMQTRIKSSFIYLANAVSDLRGNWATLALVLSPLVVLSALCLLPDALNLQHALVRTFEPGVRTIGWLKAQTPYAPETEPPPPLFTHWELFTLHLVLALIIFLARLLALCAIKRIKSGERRGHPLNETIEIYRHAIALAPAFLWISLLQLIAVAVGFVLLVIPGLLALVWLYFAPYALVFEDRRSWQALLYSRDLIRGRWLKVAVRIMVFLAIRWGFNSWVYYALFGIGLLMGFIAIWSGALCATIFLCNLVAFAVSFGMIAFFIAAGVRLYRDLQAIAAESGAAAQSALLPATAPLQASASPAVD